MKRFYERKFRFEGKAAWVNPFIAISISIITVAVLLIGFYNNVTSKMYEKTNERFGKSVLDSVCYIGDFLLDNDGEVPFNSVTTALHIKDGVTNLIYIDPEAQASLDDPAVEGFAFPVAEFKILDDETNVSYAALYSESIVGGETVGRYIAPKSSEYSLGDFVNNLWVVPAEDEVLTLSPEGDETIVPVDNIYLNIQDSLYTLDEDENINYLSPEIAREIITNGPAVTCLDLSYFGLLEDDVIEEMPEGSIVAYSTVEGRKVVGLVNRFGEVDTLNKDVAVYLINGETNLIFTDPAKIMFVTDPSEEEISNLVYVDLVVSEYVAPKGAGETVIGYQETMQYAVDAFMGKDNRIMAIDIGFGPYQVANADSEFLDDKFSVMSWSPMGNASLSDNSVDISINPDVQKAQDMFKAFSYRRGKYDSVNLSMYTSYKIGFASKLVVLVGILLAGILLGFIVSLLVKKDKLKFILLAVVFLAYSVFSLVVSVRMVEADYTENSVNIMNYYTQNIEAVNKVLTANMGVELSNDQVNEIISVFNQNVYGEDYDGFYYDEGEGFVMEDGAIKSGHVSEMATLTIIGWILGVIFGAMFLYFLFRKNGAERFLNSVYNFSTAYLFIFPGILGMMVLVFVPIVFTIVLSFTSLPKFFTEVNIARNFVGLQNFSEILFLPDTIKTSVSGNEITVKYHLLDDRNSASFEFSAMDANKWIVIEYASSSSTDTEEGMMTYYTSSVEPDLDDGSSGSDNFWLVTFQVNENGKIIRSTLEKDRPALQRLFSNPRSFYYTLSFTLLYTFLALFIQVVLGVTIAVIIHDKDVKMTGLYQVLFMLPWIIPTYISGIIWNYVFTGHGVIDQLMNVLSQASYMRQVARGVAVADIATTVYNSGWLGNTTFGFFAVSFVSAWYAFPFIMLVTLSALQTIPRSVFEAALIDGANWSQTLFKIVIPMIRPTVLPSVLLTSIWTFNNFNLVYLFTGGDDRYDILITRIYDFLNVNPEIAVRYGWTYGYAAAYSALIFVVLLAYIYVFARASKLTEKTF